MANRKILYGYQIIHGDLVIQEEERLTVQNVFTTYLDGLSYQALADRMNADNIPFSHESPLWNKHKIKRMLENPRYAGENGYPTIIDQDTFQQVQKKIAEKTSGKLPRRTESDGLSIHYMFLFRKNILRSILKNLSVYRRNSLHNFAQTNIITMYRYIHAKQT